MTSRSESPMDERWEIRPGVHKRFSDCTVGDLESSLEVSEERIEHNDAIRGLLDRLIADAEARGVSRIPVPACIHGSSHHADLPAIREQRAALEACAEELLG